MSKSRGKTVRGGREQREEKDKPRNLGDPRRQDSIRAHRRMNKSLGVCTEVGHVHSSEEGSNDPGAKGCDRELATNYSRRTA